MIVAVVAVILAGAALTLRRLSSAGARRLDELTAGRRSVRRDVVNCFGLASRGRSQIRGNGTLGLFVDEVVFVQWLPRRTVRVARESITEIDTPRAFLGKTNGQRLLAITWRLPEGGEDRIAWLVPDLDGWLGALGGPSGGPTPA